MDSGVPLIRSQNVHFDGFRDDGLAFLTPAQAEALREVTVRARDVLLNITGASIGRVAVAPQRMEGARVNQHVFIIRPREAMLPEFLRHFLASPVVQRRIWQEEYGVTRQALTKAWVSELEVPLPPLAEQRRIVENVGALLARVNEARERMEKVPLLLKRFRQSVLGAACSGRLTEDLRASRSATAWEAGATFIERLRSTAKARQGGPRLRGDLDLPDLPDSWAWVNLGYLFAPDEAFCYGVVQPGQDGPEGVPLVRAGDLLSLPESLASVRRIPVSIDAQYSRSRLRGGEILVGVVGNIGHVALAPVAAKGFNIARAVAKLPVREVSADYVLLWLRSSLARRWMVGDSREVARPTLNLEQLETLPVPLPPREEQDAIVKATTPLLAMARQVEARTVTGLALASKVPQAILQRAFAGELVPTEAEMALAEGREFESGEELLRRVMATRIATASPKSGETPTKRRGRPRKTAAVGT